MHRVAVLVAFLTTCSCGGEALAESLVSIKYERSVLQAKWHARIKGFLTVGVIPLIDLESSLRPADGEKHLKILLPAMDKLGIALIAFDGYQAVKSPGSQGYRWGYYIHTVVNAYPDRFILATNGGTNNNWFNGKGGKPHHFIDQAEEQVLNGAYPIMGEFEFRHCMSASQCKRAKRTGMWRFL